MAGERTEAATPRRLHELRSRGRVVKSADLTTALGLLASFLVLQQFGGGAVGHLEGFLAQQLRDLSVADFTPSALAELWRAALEVFFLALAPLLVILPITGLIANVGQSGPLLSGRALLPDFSRINPLAGFSRLFSLRSLVELGKTIAKVVVVGFVIGKALLDSMPALLALASPDLSGSSALLAETILRLGLTAAGALLALGVLDYGYQRWEFQRGARMTRDELREEARQTEGSPQVRARLRQRQRKLAQGRMMHAVPTATVVVTNPTHLAVALRYEQGVTAAPEVVAKGADRIAEQIKQVAREHGVPIVENQPLARALYRSVEIGMLIPVELFQAVAEVLAHIYSSRGRVGGADHGPRA